MTKSEILAALACSLVPFEAEGLTCQLRHLRAGEYADWETFHAAHPAVPFNSWLFVRSVCDDAGERLFADEDAHTVHDWALGKVNAVSLRIQAINGMRPEGDAGKVNSTTGPSSSSSAS